MIASLQTVINDWESVVLKPRAVLTTGPDGPGPRARNFRGPEILKIFVYLFIYFLEKRKRNNNNNKKKKQKKIRTGHEPWSRVQQCLTRFTHFEIQML